MTTTIHADGPPFVGGVWTDASLPEFFTVLHVLVVGVFVLSGLLAMAAAMAAVAFEAFYGCRGCGPSRASVVTPPLAMVVSFVTGASSAAWATTGPGVGLLTLGAATGLVVAVNWLMVRRERRAAAALVTAVCGQSGGAQS